MAALWTEVPKDLLYNGAMLHFFLAGLMLSLLWEMVPLKSAKLGLGHLGSSMASTAGRLLLFECLWFSDLIGLTQGLIFAQRH